MKRLRPLLAIAFLAIAGFLLWRFVFTKPKLPDNVVVLSGRIEGDDSSVAPKTSGRILEIRFREGDTVKAGEVIARLDDQQIKAREQQALGAVTQAEARYRSAQQQVLVLREQLQQSQLQTGQAKADAAGRVSQAEADLAAAESEVAQQEANFKLAAFDRDAYVRLAKSGAVSERQGKQAEATAEQLAAAVAASKRKVEAARASVVTARANLANPEIRGSQSAAVRRQIAEQEAEVASAAAETQQARAQLVEAQANRSDLNVVAPFTGTVITRSAEPGEVVSAGTAIVTLLDLNKVYLRGFIPEGQIGKVKAGQPARVFLDSNAKHPLNATVSRIDPQATFTPENTYFREDRVKQVVGVKLQLKEGIGFAKPGMPADGQILVAGDNWPQ